MRNERAGTTSRMKIVLAGVGVITCVVFAAFVVGAAARHSRAAGISELALHPDKQDEILSNRTAQELQEKLSLSKEQTEKVAEIVLGARKNVGSFLRETSGQDRETRRAQGFARIREVDEAIEGVLTEEQRREYEALREERRSRVQTALRQFLSR